MAEIILTHPRVGDMDELRSSPALPLSLLHAAALSAGEFDIAIVDMRVSDNWREELRKAIGPETLMVGITSYTGPMIVWNMEIAAEARKHTDAPIVWGGVHVSLEPGTSLDDPLCDIVVMGEGEITLRDLARALKEKKPLEGIAGIAFKKGAEKIMTQIRDQVDLEQMPDIPYSLLDVQKYMPTFKGRKSLYMQTSRGCPHACTYCYNPMFNRRKWRAQSADKALQRIRHVVEKYGVEDIYLVDDNIFIDPDRDRKIIEGIKELGITWQIQGVDVVAIKRMSDEFLVALREAGMHRLTIGVESGSPRIRKLMAKAGSIEDIKEQFKRLADHDIIAFANLLGGLPTETHEDLKYTVDLIFELLKIHPKACNSPIYIYTPYPGTKMYELAIKEGFEPPKNLRGWGEAMHWALWNWKKGGESERKLREGLYFVSNFLDRKAHIYDAPLPVRLASDIYRPLARWRVKNFRFEFLIEKYFADLAQKMLVRSPPPNSM